MSRTALVGVLSLVLTAGSAQAQVAGSTTIDLGDARVEAVAIGWSARKQILGYAVYNENGERVGKIDDLIVVDTRGRPIGLIDGQDLPKLKIV